MVNAIITPVNPGTQTTTEFDISIVFSSAVSDFDVGDISLSSGSIIGLVSDTAGTSTNWTLTVSVPYETSGNVLVSIPGTVALGDEDVSVNLASFTIAYDTNPYVINATWALPTTTTYTEDFDINIIFEDYVDGFTETDLDISSGTIISITPYGTAPTRRWVVRVSPPEETSGNIELDFIGQVFSEWYSDRYKPYNAVSCVQYTNSIFYNIWK